MILPAWYGAVSQAPVEIPEDWFDAAWSHRNKITIDATKVPGPLTDFPVLVSSTRAEWRHTSEGGDVGKSDGTDILFTADDGTTKLDHEIQSYDAATGELIAWVKVPSISDTVDTELYIYYGNDSAADQQNAAGTWADYEVVLHTESATPPDSTGNGYDTSAGTGTPDVVAGKSGQALDFKGSDLITLVIAQSFGALFGGGQDYSVTTWLRFPTGSDFDRKRVFHPRGDHDLTLRTRESPNRIRWEIWDGAASTGVGHGVSVETWHHVAVTYESGQQMAMRLDAGAADSAGAESPVAVTDDNVFGAIKPNEATNVYEGLLGSWRVYPGVLSSDWIETEYANQDDPASFYTVAAQEAT